MTTFKKLTLTVIFAVLLFTSTFINQKNMFVVLAVDSYGDDITHVEVWEDTELKANFTSSGGSVSVNASKQIKFVVGIKFNSTFASSQSEAVQYTRVYMNITGVWTNMELNNTSVSAPTNGFYWLKEEGVLAPGTLTEGQTYECKVLYQGYY